MYEKVLVKISAGRFQQLLLVEEKMNLQGQNVDFMINLLIDFWMEANEKKVGK